MRPCRFPLSWSGGVSITVGAERPFAEAIDTITAVESGASKVPGKVMLAARAG